MTKEEQIIHRFGCTIEDLDSDISDSRQPLMGGPTMLATSYLSDAQELISMGAYHRAWQTINCAKYAISQLDNG